MQSYTLIDVKYLIKPKHNNCIIIINYQFIRLIRVNI